MQEDASGKHVHDSLQEASPRADSASARQPCAGLAEGETACAGGVTALTS